MKKREEELMSEDDKKALRGSKFAPLPSLPSSSNPPHARLAHPGGPLTTNKAAALAKFLQRKLQEPNGLTSINPDLIERAVRNAKETVSNNGGTSSSGRTIKHVDSFVDCEDPFEEEDLNSSKPEILKRKNKNKKKNKRKEKQKVKEDQGCAIMKKPKKKMKF